MDGVSVRIDVGRYRVSVRLGLGYLDIGRVRVRVDVRFFMLDIRVKMYRFLYAR